LVAVAAIVRHVARAEQRRNPAPRDARRRQLSFVLRQRMT